MNKLVQYAVTFDRGQIMKKGIMELEFNTNREMTLFVARYLGNMTVGCREQFPFY